MKVNVYEFDYSKQKEFYFYFASDHHIENMQFDEETFKYEHEEAKKVGAYIFEGGDWGDFILPSDRKRYVKSRDNIEGDAVINQVVNKAVKLFKPYAKNILQYSHGNHEMSVIKYHSVDPTSMLISQLNTEEHTIRHGSYCGFIVLKFRRGKNGNTKRYVIYYNHGAGGSAEVTKGTINFNRRQYIRADIIWLQHKHTKISMQLDYEVGVNSHDQLYEREKNGLLTGCFMKNIQLEPDNKIYNTWTEQKTRVTQARGGGLLKLTIYNNKIFTQISTFGKVL